MDKDKLFFLLPDLTQKQYRNKFTKCAHKSYKTNGFLTVINMMFLLK